MAKGWKQTFDDPIPLPGGHQLVTLQAAGNYIAKLPKAEHLAPEWQTATEALISGSGGPTDHGCANWYTAGTESQCRPKV